ncbi:MAG: tetratricopeptide repeat protein [Microcoleaceae cyanobacterium]
MEPQPPLQSRLETLHQTGQQYLQQGEFLAALKLFQQLLAIAEETANTALQAEGLIQIGTIHYHLEHSAWAIKCFERALIFAQQLQSSQKIAEIYQGIGRVYFSSKQYSQALRFYVNALETLQDQSDLLGMSSTLNCLGEVYNTIGLFEEARRCCRKALLIVEELEKSSEAQDLNLQKPFKALILHNLGVAEYHRGRIHQALAYLLQALAVQQKLNHCQSENPDACHFSSRKVALQSAKTLQQIGTVYLALEKFNKAFDAYQKAEKIYQVYEQPEVYAQVLNFLGLSCYQQGNTSQSLWYHVKALEQFNQLERVTSELGKLPHILTIYREFDLLDEGVKLYRRTQELLKMLGSEVS